MVQLRRLLKSTAKPSGFLVLVSSSLISFCRGMATGTTTPKVIDSHLHVWADSTESKQYPWIQEPPDDLKDTASTSALIKRMDANGVDGALIVQPINHEYDHNYMLKTALQQHPERFKGMMLHNPKQSKEEAIETLENLALQGCVGVRFNPYLWPKTTTAKSGFEKMSECPAGLAVYKRCAELNMPVGVMCFQGLDLHYDDIRALCDASPDTPLILDHFGFTSVADKDDRPSADAVFQQLLDLSKYPQVHVKISALFRLGDTSADLKIVRDSRFRPLLKAFGSERLLYGSDFPFVILEEDQGGYEGMLDLVQNQWIENDNDRANIMGGTSERLFGPWGLPGSPPPPTSSLSEASA